MDSAEARPDGEALFLANLATIDRVVRFVARRHHLSEAETDELAGHVNLKLVEQDYAILRKFDGRSKLSTYLSVVINRLFLDVRVKHWGKWRPSTEARRMGPVAILLERLLNRDGHNLDTAHELLMRQHRVPLSRAEAEQLVGKLPARPARRFEGDAALRDMPSTSTTEERVIEGERQQTADKVALALQRALDRLDTSDRVILMMRFVDGRTAKEIATAQGLRLKPVYARIERLMERLRAELVSAGISAEEAVDMFRSVDIAVEWIPEPAKKGTSAARPSIRVGVRTW